MARTFAFTTAYGTQATFEIPTTAAEWQLFTGEGMKGNGLAAHRLSKGLEKAFDLLMKFQGPIHKAVQAADELHRVIRRKEAKFGATDTEPHYVAQQALCDFARAFTGERHDFYNCF